MSALTRIAAFLAAAALSPAALAAEASMDKADVVWFAAGYSLAFGPGSAFVGGLSHVFLNGLDINSMSGSIPTLLFVCFQMTFAILTATLMIGAFAGRMKSRRC